MIALVDKARKNPWARGSFLVIAVLVCLGASAYYANKTYRTFTVLQSARSLDVPEAGNLRAWMTFDYVATSYAIPAERLFKDLRLPAETDGAATLRSVADALKLDPLDFVQRVQDALSKSGAARAQSDASDAEPGWLTQFSEGIFSALLIYGYPVLFIVLFLGALGLPVPAGPLTTVAGTLAASGDLDTAAVCFLAVVASILGDTGGYACGRLFKPEFLARWGRYIGYTQRNRDRLDTLYGNWGGLTLILTRSLVAYIGMIASLLAGAGRYPLGRFLIYSFIGRAIWTVAYFGIGFVVGNDFETASGFLGYLSLFLIGCAFTVAAGRAAHKRHRP